MTSVLGPSASWELITTLKHFNIYALSKNKKNKRIKNEFYVTSQNSIWMK